MIQAESRRDELLYEAGWNEAMAECKKDMAKVDKEVDTLRERVRFLVSVLSKVEHTVALHGHMDVGTELFDLVCAAMSAGKDGHGKSGNV